MGRFDSAIRLRASLHQERIVLGSILESHGPPWFCVEHFDQPIFLEATSHFRRWLCGTHSLLHQWGCADARNLVSRYRLAGGTISFIRKYSTNWP